MDVLRFKAGDRLRGQDVMLHDWKGLPGKDGFLISLDTWSKHKRGLGTDVPPLISSLSVLKCVNLLAFRILKAMCDLPQNDRAKIIGIQDQTAMSRVLSTFSEVSANVIMIESLMFVELYSQCVRQLDKDSASSTRQKSCRVEVHIYCTSQRTLMIQGFVHSPIYRRRYSVLYSWPFWS